MALTTLTWNLIGPVPIVSGTLKLGLQRSKQEVLATLNDLVKSSSYWANDTWDVTGSNYEAIVLKPVSSSVMVDTRIICTVSSGNGGSQVDPNAFATANESSAIDTLNANFLMCGIAPHVGTSSYVQGGWKGEKPFGGADVRWSRFWNSSYSTVNTQFMFLIESQEVLFIGLWSRNGGSTAPAENGFLVGAIMLSFDAASGEEDQRVYGMISGGTTGLVSNMLTNGITGFFQNTALANNPHVGTFIVSGSVPNGQGGTATIPSNWATLAITTPYGGSLTTPAQASYGATMTSQENLVGLPITYYSNSRTRIVGTLRQVYRINDYPGPLVIVTGSSNPALAVPIGVTLCNFLEGQGNDTVFFGNV